MNILTDIVTPDIEDYERCFTSILQRNVVFVLGQKEIKTGRLVLFKRTHYHILITIQNSKNINENFEIPIPYKTEWYPESGLLYFDYRLTTLANNIKDIEASLKRVTVKNTSPSHYYNRILEITVT